MTNTLWQSSTAVFTALALTTGTIAPLLYGDSVLAQTQFTDVPSGYWAESFIVELANRGVIAGFPDGSFRPNAPVTRAQYAAMVKKAFNQARIRNSTRFADVPGSYWASGAIDDAYTMGFMAGYPGNVFLPNQNIPRVQTLVSLANGLNYVAQNPASAQVYSDASQIPAYAVGSVAAATEQRLVVNYPSVQFLSPNQNATRADVAAFIYQAMASRGQVAQVPSPYVVGSTPAPQPPTPPVATTATFGPGTVIPAVYTGGEKIMLLPTETLPITLSVSQPVAYGGKVAIPAGSQVVGEIRPAGDGAQFVAQELVLPNGQRFPLNATSAVVTRKETIDRDINGGWAAVGGALGSGAAAAIATITGDKRIEAWEVLIGTAAGTAAGVFLGQDKVQVISINSASDLALTLNGNITLPTP